MLREEKAGWLREAHKLRNLNYYLTKESVFWEYFQKLAKETGNMQGDQIRLPDVDVPCIEPWEEPALWNGFFKTSSEVNIEESNQEKHSSNFAANWSPSMKSSNTLLN